MQTLVADDTAWRFEIADGPNAGASVTLAPGRYRLGSDAGNDLVLADPGVSPSHAVLQLAPTRGDITALAPGVLLQRRQIETGRPSPLKCGAVVTLGATRLRVAGPPELASRHRKAPVAPCLAVLAVIGAGIVYHSATPSAVGAMRANDSPLQSAAALLPASAAAEFRLYLAGTPLASNVQISAADGAVLATGSLMPQDRAAWLDAQKWFDHHFSGRYALADQVQAAKPESLPDLKVAAVSMAPVPNIITRDGQHYTVGAVLQDGWHIARITPNDIILRDGGREIRITL